MALRWRKLRGAEVGCALQEAFARDVKEGFQASSTWHQGVAAHWCPSKRCRHRHAISHPNASSRVATISCSSSPLATRL